MDFFISIYNFGYLILLFAIFWSFFFFIYQANKKHDLTSPSSKRRESRSYSDFEYDIGPVSSWLSERQTSNRSGINDQQQQSNNVEHGIVPNVSNGSSANGSSANGNNADSDNENFQNTVDPNLISTSRFLGSHGENKSKSFLRSKRIEFYV